MEIIQPQKKDIQKLAFIEADCFPLAEAASYSDLKARYRAFPENFLIAKEEGKIVGFINGNTTNQTILEDRFYEDASLHDHSGAYMCVFGIDVEPPYQGRGIGKALMRAYIDLAKSRKKKGIVLTCKKRLKPFYESFGFTCLGQSQSTHGGALWYDMLLAF